MNRVLSSLLNRLAMISPGGLRVRPLLQRWRGAAIGRNTWLGLFVYVDDPHPEALTIGDNCTIGIRSTIITHLYWGPRRSVSNGAVVIEDDVFIGPHCVILPNVRIGQGAVVRAGTVVARNVPPRTFVGSPIAERLGQVGVPLTSDHTYEEFVRGMRLVRPPDKEKRSHATR